MIRPRSAAHRQLARAEPWLRLALPLVLGLFLASLTAAAILQGRTQRDVALSQAVEDIEALGRLASAAVASSTLLSAPDLVAARDRLAGLIPGSALPRGRQLHLVDTSDRIAASLPPARVAPTLAALIGDDQPPALLGSRAGAMELTLASGARALVTVQEIPGGRGRVAVVQPVDAATAGQAAAAGAQATLLAAASLVVVCLGLAYTLQASRARAVDDLCERVKRRVDTAFGRGRCGLWDWDIARGSVFWSDSMYEILGYTRQANFLSFGEVNDLVHPEDGDLYGLARHLAAARQGAVDHELRLRDAQGGWVWLKARAEIVNDPEDGTRHLVGIFVDITEQRRLADAGAAADARLRDAVEAISEAFVLWDAQNRLVLCNSKFQDLHNLAPGAAVPGQRYAEVMGGGSPPTVRREIPGGEADPSGARVLEAELADGRWLQVSERRTKDGGYVSVGTDVTALKRNQARLLESERELLATVKDLKRSRQALEVQAQQLADIAERYLDQKAQAESANASKSEFLANMSHELRTPLNAVMGFAELMENEVYGALGSPRYADYCRDIRASGAYLLGLIDDILDMSRIEAGRVRLAPRLIEVDEALDGALRPVAEAARAKGMQVARAVPAGATVGADARALQQILVNLLQNAVKFTPAGGRVACRVREIGAWTHLYVEDTGIGIPRHALAKIGRPFEQAEIEYSRSYKGSGLGLAIARSLTELHGGSLRIRSQTGLGTIVLVRLPRAPMPVPELIQAAEGASLH